MLVIILLLAGFSFSEYITFRNCTTYIADKVGINQRFYPKHYIKLNKKLYKILKIRFREIPKFLYVELFVIFIFVAWFPINTTVYFCSGFNAQLIWNLLVIESCVVIINLLYIGAGYLFYKYVR